MSHPLRMNNTQRLHYIGAGAAADILGISRPTLSRWVRAGKLTPAHTVPAAGRAAAYLFVQEDVEAVAADLTDKAAS